MSRVQQARCDYCGHFGLCEESPSGRYLECVTGCSRHPTVTPGGEGCVTIYEIAYAQARNHNLTNEAAHEVGLFAVYLHGKVAGKKTANTVRT